MDLGRELRDDPNKELQYAELEYFQKTSPRKERENNLNHHIAEEPVSLPLSSVCVCGLALSLPPPLSLSSLHPPQVQYATLQELNPKLANAGGGEGEEGGKETGGPGEGSGEKEGGAGGGGEGDKAMTSSTFV